MTMINSGSKWLKAALWHSMYYKLHWSCMIKLSFDSFHPLIPLYYLFYICISHMYTTHNFKMLYVYIDDIMGGLLASDLVVLMEVSQTTL